jgi:hypothetical protein
MIRPRHLSGPELVSLTEALSSGLLKAGEELMEREGVITLTDLIKVVGGEPRNLRLIGGLRLTTLLISLITARSLGCLNMRVNRGVLGRALARLITFTFALSRGNRPQ